MSGPRALNFAPPLGAASIEQDPVNAWVDDALGLVVDVGYDHNTAWMADLEPRQVLITHHHPDHAGGLAAAVDAWADAAVAAPAATHDDVDPIEHDQEFFDGRVVALATPGHSDPHLVFFDRETKGLYAGDLILGRGTPWVGPPEGSFAAYMASLEKARALDPKHIYPGHGPATGPEQLLWTIDHRRTRLDQVLEVLGQDVLDAETIVERLYIEREGMTLEGMHHMIAVMTVQGYLDYLVQQGRARTAEGGWAAT